MRLDNGRYSLIIPTPLKFRHPRTSIFVFALIWIQLKDRATGEVKANTRYWLTVDGKSTEGFTDDQGWTHTAFTDGPKAISLDVEEDGVELRA